MAIKIKSLQIDALTNNVLNHNYLYKDIQFDLIPAVSFNNQLNKQEYLNDVSALYDENAVKNSVVTAFLTAPGQKILNPTYGMDLNQYLFEPVDNFMTFIIKDAIQTGLPNMEPRIVIQNIQVIGNSDEQTYYINLQINVPSLDINGLSIKSQLNSAGYTIL